MSFALAFALGLQAQTSDIVITGQRLQDAYSACEKGGCTTLRDAQVSIALAEQQFREGAYVRAKRTLASAVSRNKSHASTDPKPVSALYEAYATVALQEGDLDVYRQAVSAQVRTLRDNLPPTDPAVGYAETAMGDMLIKLGRFRDAERVFASIERRMTAAGQDRSAMIAGMRQVWLASALKDEPRARRLLGSIEARPAAQDPAVRPALRVLRLRLAAKRGDDRQIEKVIGELSQSSFERPALIWEPPYEPTAGASAEDNARKFDLTNPAAARSGDIDGIRWADIGFWIKPDGHTDQPQVLRGSPSQAWTAPMLTQIARRRYTPTPSMAGTEGAYRVERFTLRGTYQVPIGSLIRRRAGSARLEVLDLTNPAAKPTAIK